MKISIITINFNNGSGLKATIESVINQDYKDIEYVIIDGGSTDDSSEIIKQYTDHFYYWVSEPDQGIYHAINKGLKKVRGDYILVLNSGDTLTSSSVLTEMLPFLSLDRDLVYGDLLLVNLPNGKKDFIRTYPDKLSFDYFARSALGHQACFIKKKLYEKVGFYDEGYKIVSDWKWMLEALSFFGATYLHAPVVVAHFDKQGISSTQLDLNRKERLSVLAKYEFFTHRDIPPKRSLKRMIKRIISKLFFLREMKWMH